MRVALISTSDSLVDVFPLLQEKLLETTGDLEFTEAFVPGLVDLPFKALELSENADLIVVASFYSDAVLVPVVHNKLIDVELKTGVKILRHIEESEFGELLDPKEFETEKETTVLRIAKLVNTYLLEPEKFRPKDFASK